MENLTTPKAILFGLGLIALAIASVPYSSMLVKNAKASNITKVSICDEKTGYCTRVQETGRLRVNATNKGLR